MKLNCSVMAIDVPPNGVRRSGGCRPASEIRVWIWLVCNIAAIVCPWRAGYPSFAVREVLLHLRMEEHTPWHYQQRNWTELSRRGNHLRQQHTVIIAVEPLWSSNLPWRTNSTHKRQCRQYNDKHDAPNTGEAYLCIVDLWGTSDRRVH